MTILTSDRATCANTQVLGESFEESGTSFASPEDTGGIGFVSRALRHQGLWLTLTYVGLILLMARAYA